MGSYAPLFTERVTHADLSPVTLAAVAGTVRVLMPRVGELVELGGPRLRGSFEIGLPEIDQFSTAFMSTRTVRATAARVTGRRSSCVTISPVPTTQGCTQHPRLR